MKRVVGWLAATLGGLVSVLALALSTWHLLDGTPAPVSAAPPEGNFDASALLVLVDADMAATAYADGVLYPTGSSDQLINLSDLESEQGERRDIPVANTVMGWPGSLTVSNDGRFAYVVSSRGSPPPAVEAFAEGVNSEMPVSRTLTTVDLRSGDAIELEACLKPLSVSLAPSGNWLLVACGDAGGELSVVTLSEGQPDEVRAFDLDVPAYALRETDAGSSYAVVHPAGAAAGVVLENHAVTLVRFELDADGVPASATAETPRELSGRWLSVARWTRRGDHLLVADVGWGPRSTDAVTNGPGAVLSLALAPDGEERGLVSEAVVSKSPEAFELNGEGTLLAAVNMERTYLPGGFPLGLLPGRGASSLSLVGVDDRTGELAVHGEPVGFRGVLPEDAVFDADGDQLAVVVYQDHDAPRSGGWVSFFDVDLDAEVPRLRLTDRRVPLPRGAHDLYALE